MRVHRKPETAEWYHESAQKVFESDLAVQPWTDSVRLYFDGTKDKDSERRTTFRIELTEKDVEHLYAKLRQAQKQEVRETRSEARKRAKKNASFRKEFRELYSKLSHGQIEIPKEVKLMLEKVNGLTWDLD